MPNATAATTSGSEPSSPTSRAIYSAIATLARSFQVVLVRSTRSFPGLLSKLLPAVSCPNTATRATLVCSSTIPHCTTILQRRSLRVNGRHRKFRQLLLLPSLHYSHLPPPRGPGPRHHHRSHWYPCRCPQEIRCGSRNLWQG